MTNQNKDHKKKVGWFCTYTPEELIHAAGFTPFRLLPQHRAGDSSVEDALPGNICPYPRKILSNLRSGLYEDMAGIVVANSCNAMIHLYNVLKEESGIFVYLLDVPRRQDELAVEYYTRELELLSEFLGDKGEPVDEGALQRTIEIYRKKGELLERFAGLNGNVTDGLYPDGLYGLAMEAAALDPETFISKMEEAAENTGAGEKEPGSSKSQKCSLLLAGGLPPQGLMEMLSELPELQVYPENCAGLRYLQKPKPAAPSGTNSSSTGILRLIASSYLEKPPCPRVFNRQMQEDYYRGLLEDLKVRAVIYHDLMFCDMSHYDYLMLKDLMQEKEIPHLKVKTELGEEDLGQLKTRVEAFLEILE